MLANSYSHRELLLLLWQYEDYLPNMKVFVLGIILCICLCTLASCHYVVHLRFYRKSHLEILRNERSQTPSFDKPEDRYAYM